MFKKVYIVLLLISTVSSIQGMHSALYVIQQGAYCGALTGALGNAYIVLPVETNQVRDMVETALCIGSGAITGAIGGAIIGCAAYVLLSKIPLASRICARIGGAAVGPFIMPIMLAAAYDILAKK